ncbi:hypothetical protein VTJ83DRAFT_3827 [Remersonia thermophila]|uniref:Ubiquitin-like protease family profile domain-containing protein n=1 Tax=Remersonia thermophila TaxID=72144 RepID=A0ABR4DF67_9PEZI
MSTPSTEVVSLLDQKEQNDGWSCGLHVIANTVAFLRYEALGWYRISGWNTSSPDQMRRELLDSLHYLMGISNWDPAKSNASPTTAPATNTAAPANKSKDDKEGGNSQDGKAADAAQDAEDWKAIRAVSFARAKARAAGNNSSDSAAATKEKEAAAAQLRAAEKAAKQAKARQAAKAVKVLDSYIWPNISHPVLDIHEPSQASNPTWKRQEGFVTCLNGLRKAREGMMIPDDKRLVEDGWLDGPEIYHLLERLMTWIQDQPGARLGPRQTARWWIAPDIPFTLSTEMEAQPLTDPHGFLEPQDRDEYRSKFLQARFTVHLFNFLGSHWGVIIYRRHTGDSWYFDSMPGRNALKRANEARKALEKWLRASGHPPHPNGQTVLVSTRNQVDGWSCGLHTIANAMAFLRFEVLGWDKIPAWQGTASRQMVTELLTSLHYLMGVTYPGTARPTLAPADTQKSSTKRTREGSMPKSPPKRQKTDGEGPLGPPPIPPARKPLVQVNISQAPVAETSSEAPGTKWTTHPDEEHPRKEQEKGPSDKRQENQKAPPPSSKQQEQQLPPPLPLPKKPIKMHKTAGVKPGRPSHPTPQRQQQQQQHHRSFYSAHPPLGVCKAPSGRSLHADFTAARLRAFLTRYNRLRWESLERPRDALHRAMRPVALPSSGAWRDGGSYAADVDRFRDAIRLDPAFAIHGARRITAKPPVPTGLYPPPPPKAKATTDAKAGGAMGV